MGRRAGVPSSDNYHSKIVSLFGQGVDTLDIAERLSINKHYVNSVLKRFVPDRYARRKMAGKRGSSGNGSIHEERIMRLASQGLTMQQIAARLGISASTASNYSRRARKKTLAEQAKATEKEENNV